MTQPARETVLVVDDEEMVRRLAVRMLLGQGYQSARGQRRRRGRADASAWRRSRIDGVLTDVAMPGLAGRQLGETISAAGLGSGCCICRDFPRRAW